MIRFSVIMLHVLFVCVAFNVKKSSTTIIFNNPESVKIFKVFMELFDVIFLIESTSTNGAYINEIKTNYLIPV